MFCSASREINSPLAVEGEHEGCSKLGIGRQYSMRMLSSIISECIQVGEVLTVHKPSLSCFNQQGILVKNEY